MFVRLNTRVGYGRRVKIRGNDNVYNIYRENLTDRPRPVQGGGLSETVAEGRIEKDSVQHYIIRACNAYDIYNIPLAGRDKNKTCQSAKTRAIIAFIVRGRGAYLWPVKLPKKSKKRLRGTLRLTPSYYTPPLLVESTKAAELPKTSRSIIHIETSTYIYAISCEYYSV